MIWLINAKEKKIAKCYNTNDYKVLQYKILKKQQKGDEMTWGWI